MFARCSENRITFLLTSCPYYEISLRFLPQKGILLETRRSSRPQVFLMVVVPNSRH